MLKRGQVTIFMVVGILIIFLTAGIFLVKTFLVGEELKEVDPVPLLSDSVNMYIESCIEKTGKNALVFVAQQGGYYELPALAEFGLPYYLYGNKSHIISKKELEIQISSYMNNELFFCIQDFVPFKKAGLDIEQKEIITSTKVFEEKVIFDINFPITIKQNSLAKSLAHFSQTIPSKLGRIHNMSLEFVYLDEKNPESICISCLTYLGLERDLRTEINPLREGIFLFIVIDENKGSPFEYLFLNRYEFQETEKLVEE
ncbi:MAG: hypothetical protein AABW48_04960 [Nanoarchaeota archaeon]